MDGSNDFYSWNTVTARTLYVVFNATDTQPLFATLWGSDAEIQHLFGDNDDWLFDSFIPESWLTSSWWKDGNPVANPFGETLDIGNWHLISIVLSEDGSINQMKERDDGTRVPKGKIARYIVFPTAHSTEDREAMENYLAGLYGITLPF